ncbi:MAG: hypothetical protein ACOYNR_04285 [Blastocatellia bacterium]|jgi:hypothetical protein
MSIRPRSPLHSAGLFVVLLWVRLSEPLEWPWLSPLLLCLRFYGSLTDPPAAFWSAFLGG